MKALVVDAFPRGALEEFAAIGVEVEYRPAVKAEELSAHMRDVAILVVRSTEVRADCIAAAKSLSLIIRAGAGVNNINMKAANARGIYVSNCPGKNSVAVAELTMGLLLAIDRRIVENVNDLRAGQWNKGEYAKADGIQGKTLGVIGTGQIGREVIRRALGFGLHVIAWSRSLTEEEAVRLGVTRAKTLRDVVTGADILSVHLALKPETRTIISRELIGEMRPGAIFLNTSRAEVVDEAALLEAGKAGRIRAGLDVFEGEPEAKSGPFASAIARLPNVYGTHHIGASTTQAQMAVAQEVLSIVREYVAHGTVRNWVNRAKGMPASCQLVVRHYDKPGVLANVLGDLKAANLNVQEMENVIFDGGATACCTLRLDTVPPDEVLARIRSRGDEVIQAALIPL